MDFYALHNTDYHKQTGDEPRNQKTGDVFKLKSKTNPLTWAKSTRFPDLKDTAPPGKYKIVSRAYYSSGWIVITPA